MAGTVLHVDVIGRLLDSTAKQLGVVGNNVSNVNTPGYKRQELVFENELRRVLDSNEANPADKVLYSVRPAEGTRERADGNNVDIDQEMGLLNSTATLHEAFTEILGTKLRMMRSAVTGQQ